VKGKREGRDGGKKRKKDDEGSKSRL